MPIHVSERRSKVETTVASRNEARYGDIFQPGQRWVFTLVYNKVENREN